MSMWKRSDLKRILKGKEEAHDSAIVSWPVNYPVPEGFGDEYVPEDPHITILYIPEISNPDLGFTKEDVLDALKETQGNMMIWLNVSGIEYFSPESGVPVLRVEHSYLHTYRNAVKAALAKRGIVVEETYPEYKPHITTTQFAAMFERYPNKVIAGPVELWWGDEKIKVEWNG